MTVTTKMPRHCTKWKTRYSFGKAVGYEPCAGDLKRDKNGTMVCVNCQTSYGKKR